MTDREDGGYIVGANGPKPIRVLLEAREATGESGFGAARLVDAVEEDARRFGVDHDDATQGNTYGVAWDNLRVAYGDLRRAVVDAGPAWLPSVVEWIGARAWRRIALRMLFYALLAFMMFGPLLACARVGYRLDCSPRDFAPRW